jgi:hypothetical protein
VPLSPLCRESLMPRLAWIRRRRPELERRVALLEGAQTRRSAPGLAAVPIADVRDVVSKVDFEDRAPAHPQLGQSPAEGSASPRFAYVRRYRWCTTFWAAGRSGINGLGLEALKESSNSAGGLRLASEPAEVQPRRNSHAEPPRHRRL